MARSETFQPQLRLSWAPLDSYSALLKHLALFDVLSIALGFVLRLLAGVYVVGELPTTWITLCAFFLALFLGFGKRRAEIRTLRAPSCAATARPAASSPGAAKSAMTARAHGATFVPRPPANA